MEMTIVEFPPEPDVHADHFKLQGWLKSCQLPISRCGQQCPVNWRDCFCVLRTDDLSFIAYRDEYAASFIAPHLPAHRLDSPTRPPRPLPMSPMIRIGFGTLQHHRPLHPMTIQPTINGCLTLDRMAGKRPKRGRPISQSLIPSISTAAIPIHAFGSLSTIRGQFELTSW
ncbi:hypothetical protein M3Y95_00457000 [Aphelenchoides besseyi]|nr:hypothetical protein M3Y95_00457000 [Aphelenchoides besseyi]